MQQIRNAYTNICLVLVTFTACSRAVQYGIDVPKQTEPEPAVNATSINTIPPKTDWFVVLQKAGAKLIQHATQETLSDEYKLHYAAYKGNATQLAEWIAANAQWINKPMNMDGNGNITPLHLAVFQGNIECVRLLLDKGADVRALMDKTNSYIQPIHIAAWGDVLDVLRALISAQRAVVGDCDATGKTALHCAASQGHTCCVEELLQAGSDANSEDQEGHTPLCFAFEGNHFEVIAQLVKKGANISCITCKYDSDQLLRLALAKKSYTCIAAMARKEDVSVDFYRKDVAGQTLLDCALETDHPVSIRNLLWRESGDNWNNYIDQNGTPLLHHAILGNHSELLAALLTTSTLNINAQDAGGKIALQLAAEQGCLTKVQQLLAKSGIDVNKKDNKGQTAIYASVANQQMEVAKVLMQIPAIEISKKSAYNQTLLETAFEANYISFVKKIFDSGEDINAKNSSNKTLLHRVAKAGRLEMMEALVKFPGINVNAKDIDGNAPLHLAAADGHVAAIESLVKIPGINVNAEDIDGNTPLHLAAADGHVAAIESLVKIPGINVNAEDIDGNTPLHLAAADGHVAAIESLIKVAGMEVNVKNKVGNTPLHLAAADGHVAAIESLVKIPGINVNAEDIDGNTPLHLAAADGHTAAIESLVKVAGIEVNVKNKVGNTPLHLAAADGHTAAIESLVKVAGIEVNVKNKVGNTPLNLADANGYSSLADVNGHPSVAAILLKSKNLGSGSLFKDPRNERRCQKRRWEGPNPTP